MRLCVLGSGCPEPGGNTRISAGDLAASGIGFHRQNRSRGLISEAVLEMLKGLVIGADAATVSKALSDTLQIVRGYRPYV